MGLQLGKLASKSACLIVPPLFREYLGTNLIKQGETVIGGPSDSLAPRIKLEGDVEDTASLQAQTCPYFQLREKFNFTEHIGNKRPKWA